MIFDLSPEFFKWRVTDEDGVTIGVKEDAPDKIKKEYKDYMLSKNQYVGGILIK